MKFSKSMIVLAAVAVAFGTTTLVSNLSAQANKKPGTPVAVVDIEKVFNELQERGAVEASIQSKIAELQKWEQEKRKEIAALQSDLELMKAGTDAYDQTREKLRKALIELRVELEVGQRQVEQEKALQLEGLYLKMIDTVGQVAQQQGFELVMFKDNTPPMRGANQQQIAALIQVRKCLYAADHLDLTDQVKQKMNNDFNNR